MTCFQAMGFNTGCDTVAICYAIVEPTAINTVRTGKYPLDALGNIFSTVEEVMSQATTFMFECYGHLECECTSLTEEKQNILSAEVARMLPVPQNLKMYLQLMSLSCKMY